MDMWCPDGIGRESWDRERRGSIGFTPSLERGRFRILVCFPSAGVGGASRMRSLVVVVAAAVAVVVVVVVAVVVVVIVVVAVVVEYIIILIIMVEPLELAQLNFVKRSIYNPYFF